MAMWCYEVEFVPLVVPPMYHVEGKLTRDDFTWAVRKGPGGPADDPPVVNSRPDWTGCDVRVRVSYAATERAVLAGLRARVAAEFAGARRLEIEPVAIPERALRAPEVVAAQTLDDKLQAWARLSGVAWGDRLAARATELQATEDGDAVVAAVEARLAPLATLQEA